MNSNKKLVKQFCRGHFSGKGGGIFLGVIFPGDNFPGGDFHGGHISGGNFLGDFFPGGFFRGGIFPDTQSKISPKFICVTKPQYPISEFRISELAQPS